MLLFGGQMVKFTENKIKSSFWTKTEGRRLHVIQVLDTVTPK